RTPDACACAVRVQAERNRLPLLLQGKSQRWMRDHNDGHYANHDHDDPLDHHHTPDPPAPPDHDPHHDHPPPAHHDHPHPPHHPPLPRPPPRPLRPPPRPPRRQPPRPRPPPPRPPRRQLLLPPPRPLSRRPPRPRRPRPPRRPRSERRPARRCLRCSSSSWRTRTGRTYGGMSRRRTSTTPCCRWPRTPSSTTIPLATTRASPTTCGLKLARPSAFATTTHPPPITKGPPAISSRCSTRPGYRGRRTKR